MPYVHVDSESEKNWSQKHLQIEYIGYKSV